MAIDGEQVNRIAELARLEIPPDGAERVAAQLSRVLEFAAALETLDVAGCEPASLASPGAPARADEPNGRRLPPGAATAQAPEGDEDFFLVPPVVENLEP